MFVHKRSLISSLLRTSWSATCNTERFLLDCINRWYEHVHMFMFPGHITFVSVQSTFSGVYTRVLNAQRVYMCVINAQRVYVCVINAQRVYARVNNMQGMVFILARSSIPVALRHSSKRTPLRPHTNTPHGVTQHLFTFRNHLREFQRPVLLN